MVKMLRENYDTKLRQLNNQAKLGNNILTSEDKKAFEMEAKKIVCETGITRYQFRQYLSSRYNKTIENDAITEAVELGIKEDLLQWSSPRRYDSGKGFEPRNIVLTEKGYAQMNDEKVSSFIMMIHSLFSRKTGRR